MGVPLEDSTHVRGPAVKVKGTNIDKPSSGYITLITSFTTTHPLTHLSWFWLQRHKFFRHRERRIELRFTI